MEYSHTKYPEQGYVLNVMKGEISAEELLKNDARGIQIQKEDGLVRHLIDVSELTIPSDFSFFEILAIPAVQWIEEDAFRYARVAVFTSGNQNVREAAHFYATAAQNRGWDVAAFVNREEALTWLLQDCAGTSA